MCAMPCGVTPAAHSASAAFTYTRVGCSSASAIRRPEPGTVSVRLRPPFLNTACLAREHPVQGGRPGFRLGEPLADLRDLAAGDGDAGQVGAEDQAAGHLIEPALVDP